MAPARVLVTRAPHQGSELAERLRAQGLLPVLIPAIEIVEPFSFAALDNALRELEHFDWVVFTSANAVPVFAGRRNGRVLPASLRIAAIGASTARVVQAAGLPVHLVPPQAIAESLADALLPFVRKPDGGKSSFLVVRAEEGRDHLPDTLRAAGAEVLLAPAYRTVVAEGSVALLRELFSDPANGLAAITFTSSSTARNLLALCEAAGLQLPDEVLRISIGPITSATMRELGWPPHAEAPEATVTSLADTVAKAITKR